MIRVLLRVLAGWLAVAGALATTGVGASASDAPPGSVGPAPTDQYVTAAHHLFLGRGPAEAERVRWRHVVHRHGHATFARALASSPEWAAAQLDDLYRRVLGRPPDDDGRSHWLARIAAGTTVEEVAAALHGSDEYLSRAGGRPGDFVEALYRDLLQRDADEDGRRHWVHRLAAGTARVEVARAFLGSVESRRQRVERIYATVLDRGPDTAGRAFWIDALPAMGDVALTAALASSDEYHRRVTGVGLPVVTTAPVGPGTAYPLSESWRPGCPVAPEALVAVEFPHFTMDGGIARGVLIVHRSVEPDVVTVVRALHGTRFPLAQARPVDDFGGDDQASMEADNSSGFNCRTVAGTSTWSQHAYDLAVDLNPVENPYVRDGRVEPESGAAYTDRSDVRPGMVVEGGPVVGVFDLLGWGWGGRWASAQDHQHFSTTGR